MYNFSYLLPLVIILPILTRRIDQCDLGFRTILINSLGPVILLTLSVMTYISGVPLELSVWKFSSIMPLGLKLDILSGIISTTVLLIGNIVFRYSIRYLQDDLERENFLRNLSLLISSVLLMLMSPNFILLIFSFFAISHFLFKLLSHLEDDRSAMITAKKKLTVDRISDVFLVVASFFIFLVFKSFDFEVIFNQIQNIQVNDTNKLYLVIATASIVISAMAKSVLTPFHHWLPNTMGAPTPVSAIMHAGIINAGGYLVIRMSPLLSQSPTVLILLAFVGSATTFWATVVMFTQTSIKKNLAYSTIAQMGFMMFQCGVGAYSVAIIHIVGHAFYKAYAFLNSGSAVEIGRVSRYFPKNMKRPTIQHSLLIGGITVSLMLFSLKIFDQEILNDLGKVALLIVLSLAVSQVFILSTSRSQALKVTSAMVFVYFALTSIVSSALVEIVSGPVSIDSNAELVILSSSVVIFITLFIIQNSLELLSRTSIGKWIYVRALNGGLK
ncbi:proton-conducting transporter membrane subunit [Bacteriovorax sp. DB6_IX]|uniref:proton-conducting transporter transmembrane domain-containing protein n=1 Tax=Bacteriovorax sp. DB6_IX TaxID=1353530 RepID=UPI000389F7CE|nr:proton-conducting transporter membrane subunit [Bacteriovorax sp. DB6_IX]EQC46958.1 NADH-ubiquinone/plastoquinone complex I subunit [Bacteriovorax sp. DB6_IX]